MFSKNSSTSQPTIEPTLSGQQSSTPSIISAELTVRGDLICQGDMQIEGTVEGDIKSRNLTIGQAGSVKGAVEAETVQVNGSISGQIKAKSVILNEAAQVFSDIKYERLVIEAGARLNGTCKPMGSDE